jgi:hypothetical protein
MAFGGELTWEPLERRRACRIKVDTEGNIFDREQWPGMIEFMTGAMVRLEKAFKTPLADINQKLRRRKKPEDYKFCLDCFLTADPDDATPAQQEGSDNRDALLARAEAIWREGRFKCLILYRLNEADDDWDEIQRWVDTEADAENTNETVATG